MVGTTPHNLRHVLQLLVDGHGADAGAGRGWRVDPQLHWAGLGQLAEQLVKGRGIRAGHGLGCSGLQEP